MLTQINFITLSLHTLSEMWLERAARLLCVWCGEMRHFRALQEEVPKFGMPGVQVGSLWTLKLVTARVGLGSADLWNCARSSQGPQLRVLLFSYRSLCLLAWQPGVYFSWLVTGSCLPMGHQSLGLWYGSRVLTAIRLSDWSMRGTFIFLIRIIVTSWCGSSWGEDRTFGDKGVAG